MVDTSTNGAHKVPIQLGLTVAPENISKGELMAQKENRRKVRAILAGGLVLGVGAAVTLAAWSDSEFAQGTFTSGGLNLEGSSTDADLYGLADGFGDHSSAGDAETLTFTSPDISAANLAPGNSVSSPFAVRLAAGSTVNAIVKLSSTTTVANPGLTYSVKSTNGFGCPGMSDGIYTEGATPIGSAPDATFELQHGADKDTAGGTVNLCFTVTAGDQQELTPNSTSLVTWQLTNAQS